jgi:hypothetical protein
MGYIIFGIFGAAALVLLIISGFGHDAVSIATDKMGITMQHEKLGWMDDAELTASDRQRIAAITGTSQDSNLSVIRSIQSGSRGHITRNDFELLRQDRRRARASYPDVRDDDLMQSGWFNVGMSDRVPMDFCSSHNSNGTQGADGKWYLDGGCYLSFVKAKYTERADAATTKRVLAEIKDGERQKRVAHIRRWGYYTSSSGTGGSITVCAYPDPLPLNEEADDMHIAGKAIIVIDGKDRYEFAFDASDWINPPFWGAELEKLAQSKGAVRTDYVKPPSKPWVVKDGLLARGQTGAPGRLYQSMWNAEKDDYDDTDIGPDRPASWVLEHPFGLAYLPAPDNGERVSEPGKPWYVVASYYGFTPQVSGGWTEQEAKDLLPKLQTGQSWGMQGQDHAQLNQGNLREARATQITPGPGMLVLVDRSLPVQPQKTRDPHYVSYSPGMTLGPGQSTSIGIR